VLETSKVQKWEHSFLLGWKLDTLECRQEILKKRSEILCCRRMQISWSDSVKNKAALRLSKEERVILHTINRRNGKWVSYCLL